MFCNHGLEGIVIRKIAVVITILALLLVGCSNVQEDKELAQSIYSTIMDESNKEISLLSLTTFKWDKAFLFSPYSTEKEIKNQLGVSFNDPSDLEWRDDIYLLVFMNEEKVIQYVVVERQGVNLTIGDKEYLSPSEDLIMIQR